MSVPRFRNGRAKGFAFVEFLEEESARRALEGFGVEPEAVPDRDPEGLGSIRAYQQEQEEREREEQEKAAEKVEEVKKEEKANTVNKMEKDDGGEKEEKKGDEDKKAKKKRKRGPRGLSVQQQEPQQQQQQHQQHVSFDVGSLTSLTVMPKKSWKRLRNTYLDQQKKLMGQAKGRLRKWQEKHQYEHHNQHYQDDKEEREEAGEPETKKQKKQEEKGGAKTEENKSNGNASAEKRLEIPPGTVVRFTCAHPVTDRNLLKKKVKNAFLDSGGVKYVDAEAGATVFHVRCETKEQAERLSKATALAGGGEGASAAVLGGKEEEEYRAKAEADRRERLAGGGNKRGGKKKAGEGEDVNGGGRGARRGKDKLSVKLDEKQGSHKYFTDDD